MLAQWNEKSHLAFTATTCDLLFQSWLFGTMVWPIFHPQLMA